MIDHDQTRTLLARRAELTRAEEAQVASHLDQCADCRAVAAQYERQTRLLRGTPMVVPPPALRAGVMSAVARQPALPWWRRLRPGMIALPAAAVPIAVVAALAFVHRPQTSVPNAQFGTLHTATATPQMIQEGTPVRTPSHRSTVTKHAPRTHHGHTSATVPPGAGAGFGPGSSSGATVSPPGGAVALGPPSAAPPASGPQGPGPSTSPGAPEPPATSITLSHSSPESRVTRTSRGDGGVQAGSGGPSTVAPAPPKTGGSGPTSPSPVATLAAVPVPSPHPHPTVVVIAPIAPTPTPTTALPLPAAIGVTSTPTPTPTATSAPPSSLGTP